jgi:hypothetical protein
MLRILALLAAVGFFMSDDSVPLRALIAGETLPAQSTKVEKVGSVPKLWGVAVDSQTLLNGCSQGLTLCHAMTEGYTRIQGIGVSKVEFGRLARELATQMANCQMQADARWPDPPVTVEDTEARRCVERARINFVRGTTAMLESMHRAPRHSA